MMERNRSLDLAKGIAIILVVLGHAYSFSDGNFILNWINGFHMPFFFIISGILYGQKHHMAQMFCLKLGSKVKTLWVPYFVFEILFLFYLCLAQYLSGELTADFVIRKFFAVLNLTGLHSTWFLPCMLFVHIFFWVCSRGGNRWCVIATVCLAMLGLVFPAPAGYQTVVLRSFVALGFFAAGFFGNKWWQIERKPLVIMISILVYCVFAEINGLVNIVSCIFNNPLLYMLNAFLGTFLLLQMAIILSHHFDRRKIVIFLEYAGRNSIIILCTHAFIIEAFRLVDHKLFHNFLPELGYFEGILFTVLILLAEIPVMYIGKRYVPAVFGLRKRIKNEN